MEGLTVQLQNLYPSISRCFAFRNFLNNFSIREGDNLPALVDLGQDSHRLPRTGLCILSLRVPSIGLSTSSLIFKPIKSPYATEGKPGQFLDQRALQGTRTSPFLASPLVLCG